MLNNILKGLFVCAVALGFAAKSPAPVGDAPEAKIKVIVPERSQERLTQEQQLNGTHGVVGKVPMKTSDGETGTGVTKYNPEAAGSVLAGSNRADILGNEAINTATKRVETVEKRSWSPFIALAILAAICFIAMRGAKGWLDKNVVPNPAKKGKSNREYF